MTAPSATADEVRGTIRQAIGDLQGLLGSPPAATQADANRAGDILAATGHELIEAAGQLRELAQ